MYYEARIKQGRKVVFSYNVTSMDDALDWFIKFSSSSNLMDLTFHIIPKFGCQ